MTQPSDVWYVRLPDGRVLRAGSTSAVRHHLESGRIPADSRVRRSAGEAWVTLQWTQEFADLAARRGGRGGGAPSVRKAALGDGERHGSDAHALHLQTVGVRGVVEELLTALDSALVRSKLVVAAALGLACAVALFLTDSLRPGLDYWAWVLVGLALVGTQGVCSSLLTQMTFVELSRLRPARRSEVTTGLARNAGRLILTQGLVGGVVVTLILGMRALQPAVDDTGPGVFAALVVVVRLVLEVLLWPILALCLLLGPIVVIEECSFAQALRQWVAFLRQHINRVFVYEALAAALGAIVALPFLVPVALAAWACGAAEWAMPATHVTLWLLAGLALTPLLAYLLVANVFIYLNLRYEHTPAARGGA
jgi:hypothetical protein